MNINFRKTPYYAHWNDDARVTIVRVTDFDGRLIRYEWFAGKFYPEFIERPKAEPAPRKSRKREVDPGVLVPIKRPAYYDNKINIERPA